MKNINDELIIKVNNIPKLIVKDLKQNKSNNYKKTEANRIKISVNSIPCDLSNVKEIKFLNTKFNNKLKISYFKEIKSIKYYENTENNAFEDCHQKLITKNIYNISNEKKNNSSTSNDFNNFKIPFRINYKSRLNIYTNKLFIKGLKLKLMKNNLSNNSNHIIKNTNHYEYISRIIDNEVILNKENKDELDNFVINVYKYNQRQQ